MSTIAVAACNASTAPLDPGNASYAVAYDTARLVASTPTCDRFFTHAVMSLGREGHFFEVSANFMENCTRGGTGWSYWEVYFTGHYAVNDTTVTFTPDPGPTAPFTGSFDGAYLIVTLPARPDSMGAGPIVAQLGPRMPF